MSSQKKVVVINQAQAPYYKCLYESLGKVYNLTYITLDKHYEGYKGHKFCHELILPDSQIIVTREVKANRLPLLGNWVGFSYWNFLKEANPDEVIIHETSLFNFAGFLYALVSRKKILISTEIGKSNYHKLGFFSKVIRKVISPLVKGVVAHSPAALESDFPIKKGAAAQAFHAIDTGNVEPKSLDEVTPTLKMVFLGQIIRRKGLDLLFNILKKYQLKGYHFQLDIVGRGEIEWAKESVRDCGLTKYVNFLGFKEGEDLDKILRGNDVFVLPSRFDTYGAVTQEVASRGLALFISKNAGSHIMVNEGENGYVFNPENVEESLDKLVHFAEPQKRKHLMKQSRKIAEDFCASISAVKIAKLINNNGTQ